MTKQDYTITAANKPTLASTISFAAKPLGSFVYSGCFTCTKMMPIAVHLTRTLAEAGFSSVRYDPQGIGQSEGSFEHSNFLTSQDDFKRAGEKLVEVTGHAPDFLIGHSWGGLVALSQHHWPHLKGIITIGTPSHPSHVLRHFEPEVLEQMEEKKRGRLLVAGIKYHLSWDFVKTVQQLDFDPLLQSLKVPLLILHSPGDSMVSFNQASHLAKMTGQWSEIRELTGMDHVLSKREDAIAVGVEISKWCQERLQMKSQD